MKGCCSRIEYNGSMPVLFSHQPAWIASGARLQNLAQTLRARTRLAVDTESNSLYAYQERVCLIQFSTHDEDFLVDPLEIQDLSPLGPVFADPGIVKVFHAAEYDILCLKRDYGFEFLNIFDTMQAARILGYKRTGLEGFLRERFGVNVDKHYQKADWSRRPLRPEMLAYACTDTHYLLPLQESFQSELIARDRWDLAREEFQRISCLAHRDDTSMESPWQKIAHASQLDDRQLAILQQLSAWREQQARKMDRPVFKVLSDRLLVELAGKEAGNLDELKQSGLTDRQCELFGLQLLKVIRQGTRSRPVRRPRRVRLSEASLRRLEALREWRKSTALAWDLESDIVLPKAFLHAIADKNPQDLVDLEKTMPGSPWRLKEFGEQILAVIKERV